jgi:arylformamidase
MKIYDISKELLSSQVFLGDTTPTITKNRTIDDGGYNLSTITMSVHNATHVDAPIHFLHDGKDIAQVRLDIFIGKALVKEYSGVISAQDIYDLPDGTERLLVKGKAFLSEEACVAMGEKGIVLTGTESLSVGGRNAIPIHLALLTRGIIPLESIDLKDVPEGEYFLSALPIKISGSDGSPVRAVLIEGLL